MKKLLFFICAGLLTLGFAGQSIATPIFWGPSPYLSEADIPVGFYEAGGPILLENFEDSTLHSSITASGGYVIPPYPSAPWAIDSVDGDDGTIDGSGSGGHSWFFPSGSTGVSFTFVFSSPVTAAGLVWTDGSGTTTFEAFGIGGATLGTMGPFSLADGSYGGGTAEDRFFGVQDLDGISAIKISNTNAGIEVDHVQYGNAPVPEPSTILLLVFGLLGLVGVSRKKLF